MFEDNKRRMFFRALLNQGLDASCQTASAFSQSPISNSLSILPKTQKRNATVSEIKVSTTSSSTLIPLVLNQHRSYKD